VLVCAITCCKTAARKVPTNYVLLGSMTLCATYFAAVVSSFYETRVVFMAMGLTLSCFVVLTLYAFQVRLTLALCSCAALHAPASRVTFAVNR